MEEENNAVKTTTIRRRTASLALTSVLGVLGFGIGQAHAAEFVGFAGGPPGGSFFPAAGAIASFVEKNAPDLKVAVESSGGSGENVRLVNAGNTDMGIAFAGDLHTGYVGGEHFTGMPQKNLRAIGMVFWGYGHLVALKGSGISSIKDLKGKRLAIGGTGTGSALTGERLFKHLGLLDQVRVSYIGGNAASTALKDGQVDAYNWHSGAPNAAVLDTVATRKAVLLDLATPAAESGFLETYPFYALGEIPAGVYAGVDKPIPTILTGTYWFTNKDVGADIVYKMTKAAYSDAGHAHMVKTFALLRDMTRTQALQGLTIPLHPGAQRYWEEVGVKVPERIRAR